MNIIKAISYIQYITGEIISFTEAARVCGKTRVTIDKYKTQDITEEIKLALETEYDCKLPADDVNGNTLAHDYIDIPYWEGCSQFGDKLIVPDCAQISKDLEIVVNRYKAEKENLRIIAMPSDKMKGPFRPIKYGDILIIDISSTDISYSGIYFFTANNDVFVNRIDKGIDNVIFRFDNELYSEKSYSFEELENAGFKVIGRVIHVESENL